MYGSNDSVGSPEVSQAESDDSQDDESSETEREEVSSHDKGSGAADYGYGAGGDVSTSTEGPLKSSVRFAGTLFRVQKVGVIPVCIVISPRK